MIRSVLARTPDHAAAREADLKIAAALGERAVVEPALAGELDRLSRARRFIDVHELYGLVEQHLPDLPLTDRALAQVIHAAADQKDVDAVERAMRRLVVEHRDSALIPKALWDTAQAQLAASAARKAAARSRIWWRATRWIRSPSRRSASSEPARLQSRMSGGRSSAGSGLHTTRGDHPRQRQQRPEDEPRESAAAFRAGNSGRERSTDEHDEDA